mmetsp:Transcript_24390/g.45630  ORF Transcript_24390/g.45630 Transcript_24390/m.45630 type:complete len:260 (-) Transcript_24390:262-1041(-)
MGKRGFLLVGRPWYISRIWGWKLKATTHTGTPSIASAAAPPRPSPRKSTGADPTSDVDESTTEGTSPSFALTGHIRATSRRNAAKTPAYDATVVAEEYEVNSTEGSCKPAPKLNTAGHDIHHASWSGKAVFAKGVMRSAHTMSWAATMSTVITRRDAWAARFAVAPRYMSTISSCSYRSHASAQRTSITREEDAATATTVAMATPKTTPALARAKGQDSVKLPSTVAHIRMNTPRSVTPAPFLLLLRRVGCLARVEYVW